MTERRQKRPRRECPQKSADVRDRAKSAGHGTKPEAVRETAILALLSEKTIAAAAKGCGVNERTLRRWMTDDEEFKRELADARRATFQAGMNRVQALTAQAVETLEALMRPKVPPAVRLGAARTVAELGTHQHDAETILEKLEQIEAFQREQDNRR